MASSNENMELSGDPFEEDAEEVSNPTKTSAQNEDEGSESGEQDPNASSSSSSSSSSAAPKSNTIADIDFDDDDDESDDEDFNSDDDDDDDDDDSSDDDDDDSDAGEKGGKKEKKKRKKNKKEKRKRDEDSDDDDDDDDDDEDGGSDDSADESKKKKSKKKKKKSKDSKSKKSKKSDDKSSQKKKKPKLFDEEAEESGSEKDSSDDESDDENENEYQIDGFVVGESDASDASEKDSDDDGSDDDDDGLFERIADDAKKKKDKKKKLKRLKKTGGDTLDEDELALLRQNEADGVGRLGGKGEIDIYSDEFMEMARAKIQKRGGGAWGRSQSENIAEEDEDGVIAPVRMDGGLANEDEDEDGEGLGGRPYGDYGGDDDGSSLDGFLVNEFDDEEGEDGGEMGDRRKQMKKKSSKSRQPVRRDGGPTYEQLKDAEDIFGVGFDDFDDEEELGMEDEGDEGGLAGGVSKAERKLRSTLERSVIVENFCTEADDKIRALDIPERLQPYVQSNIDRSDESRKQEAIWMAAKFIEKMKIEQDPAVLYVDYETLSQIQAALADSLEHVLRFIFVENNGIPFIWAYRKDYLHPKLLRKLLWDVLSYDTKWARVQKIKNVIKTKLETIRDAASSRHEVDDGTEEQEQRLRRIRELVNNRKHLEREQKMNEEDLQQAYDAIDAKDEPTAEDHERVEHAQQVRSDLEAQLAETNATLAIVKKEAAQAHLRKKLRSTYRPEAAEEVLRLFPQEKYEALIDLASDEQPLNDIYVFINVLLKGVEAKPMDGNQDDDREGMELEKEGIDLSESKVTKKKIAGKQDQYRKLRKVGGLRELAEAFTIPVAEFGDCIRHNFKSEPPNTGSQSADDLASQFVDPYNTALDTVDKVLKAVTIMLATELSAEPSVRDAVRQHFKRLATISTRATKPKGINTITPFNEHFGLHYLDRKPLNDFYLGQDRTLYARLLQAEADGLITITLDLPTCPDPNGEMMTDLGQFFHNLDGPRLMHFYDRTPTQYDNYPMQNASWGMLRFAIMQMCLEKFLLPSLLEETKRDLLRIGREVIVEQAAANFAKMASVGPYRPPPSSEGHREQIKEILRGCPHRPRSVKIMSVFLSSDDREPMFLSLIDREGVTKAGDVLPAKAKNLRKEKLRSFVAEHRPQIIVINSSGGAVSKIVARLLQDTIIKEVGESIRKNARDAIEERMDRGDDREYEGDEDENFQYESFVSVVIIKDEVARIFKSSTRSKKMFPDMQPGAAAAVCLARFVREPLAEYCNLWSAANSEEFFGYEAEYLDVHPLKALLHDKKPMIAAMERELVNAVCDVGLDFNTTVQFDHLSMMLAFVGGLGLRKAHALRSIVRSDRPVSGRREILKKKMLGPIVYNNSIGFLRIFTCENVAELGGTIELCEAPSFTKLELDPLDNTRIHPECYVENDFAPKLCADAQEDEMYVTGGVYSRLIINQMQQSRKELEKKMKLHPEWLDLWTHGRPIPGVTKYIELVIKRGEGDTRVEREQSCELPDFLQLLDLDNYIAELELAGKGKRRQQLEDIKEEIRFPGLDWRTPMTAISDSEMFTIVTGESDHTLHPGLKTTATVVKIEETTDYNGRKRVSALCKTDAGLMGKIDAYDILDSRMDMDSFDIREYLSEGMRLMAVVVGVQKRTIKVDLSIKPSLLKTHEDFWLENRRRRDLIGAKASRWFEETNRAHDRLFDNYFNEAAALKDYREIMEAEAAAAAGTAAARGGGAGGVKGRPQKRVLRNVIHPLFKNISHPEACALLNAATESGRHGEVIIRPSSKGPDRLVITWAFQPDIIKIIEVEEKGKLPGSLGLGSQLYILDDFSKDYYSDLDEIEARYIKPMNELVAQVVNNEKFMRGNQETVERALRQELEESRSHSTVPKLPWAIRFGDRGGHFIFTVLSTNPQSTQPLKQILVHIRPDGFVPKDSEQCFPRLSSCLYWLKQQVLAGPKTTAGRGTAVAGVASSSSSSSSAATSGVRKSRFERDTNANMAGKDREMGASAMYGSAPPPLPYQPPPPPIQPPPPPPPHYPYYQGAPPPPVPPQFPQYPPPPAQYYQQQY